MKYKDFLEQFRDRGGVSEPSAFGSQIGGRPANMKFQDLPFGFDPTNYKTHIPFPNENDDELYEEEDVLEQELPPEEEGEDEVPPPEEGGGIPPEGDPGMGGMDPGMDPNAPMDPMDPNAQQLSAVEIGRVYELKKIYNRLLALENYIFRVSDDDTILEVRKAIGEAINLFEVVISNFDQFKDRIDEIIIQFYKFIDKIYEKIHVYFKRLKKND